MRSSRTLEQHVAVFGEAGSGKTVLVSSFYGASQEPRHLKRSLFDLIANHAGQGTRLQRNYLGMRDSNRVPEPTSFESHSYSFTVRLKDAPSVKAAKRRPFDALNLVWHDYPGEWFESGVSGVTEHQRKVETFRSLLGSDVAVFLVDGQRLLDNAGSEERYLKSLFSNFRNGLLSIKDEILPDGEPLVTFPRIWILALSKADLLPEVDVYRFRDLVIEKAGEDLDQLRTVLEGFVQASEALAVGEDFLLLSSARFEADTIAVQERVGIDLFLPLAATLPLERHVRWVHSRQLPGKVAESLLAQKRALNYVSLALGLLGKVRAPGPLGVVQGVAATVLSKVTLEQAVTLAGDKLRAANAEALAKEKNLTAMLTGFRIRLEDGEREQTLLRSRR
ncbi:TRAFAC clade GTPase domain-containing protein [Bogoriella caseilytica]|uniref:Double-GTPase 2 domain-containing protein n=1 Tax=Bogoriella caseilytica TaxID=56055 RepID=A0A3N2BA11_9MICO|nr:ATP/GTP-binding protein [Bogoriella caseilytica]ROR72087.1 hypothetical protein EDD31_0433 [Bogoriella caseilytica]